MQRSVSETRRSVATRPKASTRAPRAGAWVEGGVTASSYGLPVDYRRDVSGLAVLRRHQASIGLWVLAVLFATSCVLLGRWQLHRYQDKRDRAQLVSGNYDAAPVPLREVLAGQGVGFDPRLQWRPVRVSGRYDSAATSLVRNRPRTGGGADAVFGYEVVVPLRLDDGSALLVDRGWLPSGSRGSTPGQAPDAVPDPPTGRVELVVRLKKSEPGRGGDLPPGQVASIAIGDIAAGVGYPVLAAYGVLARESPSVTPAPAPLDRPVVDGGEGINASYAVQWGLFAVLGLGFPVWVARRRRTAEAAAAHSPLTDVPVSPLQPAQRRRIWDADDE